MTLCGGWANDNLAGNDGKTPSTGVEVTTVSPARGDDRLIGGGGVDTPKRRSGRDVLTGQGGFANVLEVGGRHGQGTRGTPTYAKSLLGEAGPPNPTKSNWPYCPGCRRQHDRRQRLFRPNDVSRRTATIR
ncbi:MAG: hypothetical protein Ct9H300mP1_00710 [Planctomycetaceae bacterium]|nr:MAG: hypothetical protein Ct9H300mP1_00710 [Planctomycetaceae bacterium]